MGLTTTGEISFWCDELESNQQVPVGGFHSSICGFTLGVHAIGLPPHLFCIFIVTYLRRFVKGFLEIFSRKLRAGRLGHTQPLPTVRHLAWVSQLPRCSLPLTQISYHILLENTRWNIAQKWDKIFVYICTVFLLTKVAWRVIMEISARSGVGGPTKTATLFTAEAQGWRELISIFNFNFWGGKPRYFHFINNLLVSHAGGSQSPLWLSINTQSINFRQSLGITLSFWGKLSPYLTPCPESQAGFWVQREFQRGWVQAQRPHHSEQPGS